MEKPRIIISGLPGKMATAVAETTLNNIYKNKTDIELCNTALTGLINIRRFV